MFNNKTLNWPIFINQNYNLRIKNGWVIFLINNNNILIYILVVIITIYILIYILLYNYISHHDEIYNHYWYINNDSYNLLPSTINFISLVKKYKFYKYYVLIFIKFPYYSLGILFNFFFKLNNIMIDNMFYNIVKRISYIKLPLSYIYYSYYLDRIFYHTKTFIYMNWWVQVCESVWNSTYELYTFNRNSLWYNLSTNQTKRHVLYIEYLKPYLHVIGLYFYYLYKTNPYNPLFVDFYDNFLLSWGNTWGFLNFLKIVKYIKYKSLIFAHFNVSSLGNKVINLDYNFLFTKLRHFSSYFLSKAEVWFPHYLTFFFNTVYLPVYVPFPGFNQFIITNYNNFLTTTFFNYSNLNLSFFIKDFKQFYWLLFYLKNSYMFIYLQSICEIWAEYFKSIYFDFNAFYTVYFVQNDVDLKSISLNIKYFLTKLYDMRHVSWYGFWGISIIWDFIKYFLAYSILIIFIYIIPSARFRDLFTYTLIWFNPFYLWKIYVVNHHLENDYMLAVDYYSDYRWYTYVSSYMKSALLFHVILFFFSLLFFINKLDLSLGIGNYFLYPSSGILKLQFWLIVCYIILPLLVGYFFTLLKSFYRASIFQYILALFRVFLVFFRDFIIVKLFPKFKILFYTYSWVAPNNLGADFNKMFHSKFNKYWTKSSANLFDLEKLNYVNKINVTSRYVGHTAFERQKLDKALLFIDLTNLTWNTLRNDHFYVYYDK